MTEKTTYSEGCAKCKSKDEIIEALKREIELLRQQKKKENIFSKKKSIEEFDIEIEKIRSRRIERTAREAFLKTNFLNSKEYKKTN